MILFEKTFPPALAGLAETLEAATVETWSFDDSATRRRAEARLAARGITARCRSAYKPLLCAFREEIETAGLTRARITWPRHKDAGPRRFLLESYPLTALFPAVAFEFTEGAESPDLPRYDLSLIYADGREVTTSVLAPNRSHPDDAGNTALSPCGWLIADGKATALATEYETLFHQAMQAIRNADWQAEPYFQELNITASLPIADEDLGHGDEIMSLREALHEDFYFSALEHFQKRSGRAQGDRRLQPGQIVPEIRLGALASVRVETRALDGASVSDHRQPLETAERALSQVQIAEELTRIPGARFAARSVAGRPVAAVHHPGSDRAMMISAGQHANEISAPIGALRAGLELAKREGAHFTLSPLENPDGYALHQRLTQDNARHMHHAARYTALGDDLEYREGAELYEQAIRREAEARSHALLHVNLHGYPAHEWTRPLSGYVPRGFEMWTIPKGFFLVMRHATGWEAPAQALMDQVTRELGNVPGLADFNAAQIALFERHAGETGFQMLNGFPVLIGQDDRHRVPMTLITEYPDETIYGDALRAGHAAQMATVLAAYAALQALPAAILPTPLIA
ncbi:peptidase M14 [Paracoccus sp. (in: a-proteobacteria)]|uniref:peptidase M14 n=1 Tax=Paracoccus sp. TaxID=267 RepID=UPI00322071E3